MRLRTGSAMKPRSKWRPWVYESLHELRMLRERAISRQVLRWALFAGALPLFQSRQIGWTQPALDNRKCFWHTNRNNLAGLHFNPHLHWWIGWLSGIWYLCKRVFL